MCHFSMQQYQTVRFCDNDPYLNEKQKSADTAGLHTVDNRSDHIFAQGKHPQNIFLNGLLLSCLLARSSLIRTSPSKASVF